MAKLLPWKKPPELPALQDGVPSRPMVEVALPTPREPAMQPPTAIEEPDALPAPPLSLAPPPSRAVATVEKRTLVEPSAAYPARVEEEQPARLAVSQAVAVVDAASALVPRDDEEDGEPPSETRLNLLTDAPVNPRRRQVVEFVSRAADEIPSEVEKVLRFWLQANDAS